MCSDTDNLRAGSVPPARDIAVYPHGSSRDRSASVFASVSEHESVLDNVSVGAPPRLVPLTSAFAAEPAYVAMPRSASPAAESAPGTGARAGDDASTALESLLELDRARELEAMQLGMYFGTPMHHIPPHHVQSTSVAPAQTQHQSQSMAPAGGVHMCPTTGSGGLYNPPTWTGFEHAATALMDDVVPMPSIDMDPSHGPPSIYPYY